MKKVKLNDYCEFPSTLNMEPYTTVGLAKKDAELRATQSDIIDEDIDDEENARRLEIESLIAERPPSYYQYNLMGVLVHRGTSDSGHYYSFIKERVPSSNTAQWFEFNDKEVKPFDPKVTVKYNRSLIGVAYIG
jgi:ubiquitin C-terminal hydrolase